MKRGSSVHITVEIDDKFPTNKGNEGSYAIKLQLMEKGKKGKSLPDLPLNNKAPLNTSFNLTI